MVKIVLIIYRCVGDSECLDEPRSRCRSWDDVGPPQAARMEATSKQHPILEATRSNASAQSARSEDSWCSASDHDLSSDDESEKSNVSVKLVQTKRLVSIYSFLH